MRTSFFLFMDRGLGTVVMGLVEEGFMEVMKGFTSLAIDMEGSMLTIGSGFVVCFVIGFITGVGGE